MSDYSGIRICLLVNLPSDGGPIRLDCHDWALLHDIRMELFGRPELANCRVCIAVGNGMVRLGGMVGDERQRHFLKTSLLRVPGVTEVSDWLDSSEETAEGDRLIMEIPFKEEGPGEERGAAERTGEIHAGSVDGVG